MSNSSDVDAYAEVLWDYLQLHQKPAKSDIIFCLCSHDVRVARRAAELMLGGYGKYIVFSGGVGKLTAGMFSESEAQAFADIAIKAGVAKDCIIIEDQASNTGENIRFTHELLSRRAVKYDSMLLVQKPYMERRTYATFIKQWPDKRTTICITSPKLTYNDYMDEGALDKNTVINVMVGDMQRIREYPRLGFQIEQDIPDNVWDAFNKLVNLGYSTHLLAGV